MEKVIIKSCPLCETQLEEGYLSFGGFLKWFVKKPATWHTFGGKLLAGHTTGNVHRNVRAIKCSKCHLVMFLPELRQE